MLLRWPAVWRIELVGTGRSIRVFCSSPLRLGMISTQRWPGAPFQLLFEVSLQFESCHDTKEYSLYEARFCNNHAAYFVFISNTAPPRI